MCVVSVDVVPKLATVAKQTVVTVVSFVPSIAAHKVSTKAKPSLPKEGLAPGSTAGLLVHCLMMDK